MKKNATLFVLFVSIITMLPGLSLAAQDNVNLGDAIKILQVLTGGSQPPAFNATGTWAVKSSLHNITRTGEVFLDMKPDGRLTGYAELTSLSGLVSVTGYIHGLSFDLEMTSDFGSIVVHGQATSDGQNINGSFYNKEYENIVIHWDGYRQTVEAKVGTYVYDSQLNSLSLTYAVGAPQNFNVSGFTETTLNLNGQIYERNNADDIGNIVGIWRNIEGSIETIMTFDENGNFSYIQKQID
jgi:hypothetical protein